MCNLTWKRCGKGDQCWVARAQFGLLWLLLLINVWWPGIIVSIKMHIKDSNHYITYSWFLSILSRFSQFWSLAEVQSQPSICSWAWYLIQLSMSRLPILESLSAFTMTPQQPRGRLATFWKARLPANQRCMICVSKHACGCAMIYGNCSSFLHENDLSLDISSLARVASCYNKKALNLTTDNNSVHMNHWTQRFVGRPKSSWSLALSS